MVSSFILIEKTEIMDRPLLIFIIGLKSVLLVLLFQLTGQNNFCVLPAVYFSSL